MKQKPPLSAVARLKKKAAARVKEHDKPLLVEPRRNWRQTQVIAVLAQTGALTIKEVVCHVYGKRMVDVTAQDVNTMQKSVAIMVTDGCVLRDKAEGTYALNRKKVSASHSLGRLLNRIPTNRNTAITVGLLGGAVFGNDDPPPGAPRDLWRNVRFGRATGAILKRLLEHGFIGVERENASDPRRYWRKA